jgi:hypothetical protein
MSEASTNASDSGSKKKTSQNLLFSVHWEWKREVGVGAKKVWDGGGAEMKEAAERARMEILQRMQIHRDMMPIQKQEIEDKVQCIQNQVAQHNSDMKLRVLQLEQKMEKERISYLNPSTLVVFFINFFLTASY